MLPAIRNTGLNFKIQGNTSFEKKLCHKEHFREVKKWDPFAWNTV
jgi:hypothetical protein